MLKDSFPKVFARYESSHFCAELEAFAHWLHVMDTFAAMRRHVAWGASSRHLRPFNVGANTERSQIAGSVACLLVPCAPGGASTERVYSRFLKEEGRLEKPKPTGRVGQLRLRYRQYLEDVRGLASATIG